MHRLGKLPLAALAPLLAAALAFAAGATARASSDPDRQWFTLVTEHFAVHAYDGGEPFARRVAALAEEAHATLDPLLGWDPPERVHITCFDDVDATNGFANIAPLDAIRLYAHPPDAGHELGEYDDWLRLLVFHEYAHVLHLDHASGLPRLVNLVFGKTIKPNSIVPRWYAEGIAVWVESTRTGGGRIGSSLFEMYLRTSALANRLPSLSELTGAPIEHPRGTSWYLYGGYLFDHIAKARGPEAVRELIAAYGERIMPYGLHQTARRITGKDLDAWYGEVLDGVRWRTQATEARVRAEGLREGQQRTTGGEGKRHPRFSPDGSRLAWLWSSGYDPQRLVLAPPEDPARTETVIDCYGGCGVFDFSRDGRELVVATTRPWRRVNRYHELRVLPAEVGLDRRAGRLLTEGARAGEPAVSPDGERVWVSTSRWGETWIEARDPLGGHVVARWDPPRGARVDRPVPAADGRTVYVTMHHGGNRDLYAVDTVSGAAERLTFGRSLELDPTLTADGRWLVYSSDATGIFNVYARELTTGRTHQLSNVRTGAFEPVVSPDGATLVYVGWTADGDELFTMPFDPEDAPVVAVADPKPLRPAPPLRMVEAERAGYSPLPNMLPRSWSPTLVASTQGVARVGLSLGGLDLTDRLSVSLFGEYDIERQDGSAQVTLGVGLGWPDLSLSLGRYTWDRTSFWADAHHAYREEVYFLRADLGLPLPDAVVPMGFGVGLTADLSRALRTRDVVHTPDEHEPYVPREGAAAMFQLSWSLNDTHWHALSISPQSGGSAQLAFQLRFPFVGAETAAWTMRYSGRRYFTMPWLRDHVAMLALRGGWTGGDKGSRGSFTLGGPPQQDIIGDLVNDHRPGATYLRGYPTEAIGGPAFHQLTAEYRLPIWRVRRGFDSLPVFIGDLSAAVFSDVGMAYAEPVDVGDLEAIRASVGVELRITVELFYNLQTTFRLGYARGLGPGGLDQVYFLMAPQP